MKSTVMKVCSWILTLVMLINMLPAHVLALDVSGTFSESSAAAPADDLPVETMPATTIDRNDASILHEIVDKRTEFSKEYKLANGLHMTVMYPEAVHYQADGQWEDVNSTLKMVGTRDSAVFTNTADAWQVMLPQTLSQDTDVSITADGYTISFRMAGELKHLSASSSATLRGQETIGNDLQVASAQRSAGAVCSFDYATQKAQSEYPETVLENLRSRLTYEEVYQNTDIIYDLSAGRLKESIVIREYDANLRGYRYILDTDGLIPVLNDDGSIDLYARDSEDAIFTMPAPYMIDDAGEMNFDVIVTLEQKNGEYVLTYTVPSEWLADDSRAWPVVLDPVVTMEGEYNNVQDKTIMQSKTTSASANYVQCGWREDSGIQRGLVQYNELPELTSADVIVNATLRMWKTLSSDDPTVIEVHQVLGTWQSSTVTWANYPGYNAIVEDYTIVQDSGYYSWDVTDIVLGWYAGQNTGLMLKTTDAVEEAGVENVVLFRSSDIDTTSPELGPTLIIEHRSNSGLEDYWDYTTTSAGRAGTGYINNFSGSLTWVHNDIGFDGNIMPVFISHIYNTDECQSNSYGLGYGWRTNYHQSVELSEYEDYYIWTDGDGTEHDFHPSGSANTYIDVDGLQLTLTVFGEGCILTDKYGNASYFDTYGRMTRTVNNQQTQRQIMITYSGTSGRIAQIRDGVGRIYKFTYNSDNLLTKIGYHGKNGADGEEITNIRFSYNNDRLVTITYADNMDSHFAYIGNYLITATNIDLTQSSIQYSSGTQKRVVMFNDFYGEYSDREITLTYMRNKVRIYDNSHTTINHYDSYGNVISKQDDEGNAQFWQYAEVAEGEGNSGTARYNHQMLLASKPQNTVVNLLYHHSFEGSNTWTTASTASSTRTTSKAYIGKYSLKVTLNSASSTISAYGPSITIPQNETCTFSAYVQSSSANIQIGLGTTSSAYVKSPTQSTGSEWNRLEVSYTNSTSAPITVRPLLIMHTGGVAYVDCIQTEFSAGASRYNLVQNGDFRTTAHWSSGSGRTTISAAAPQLDATAYKMTGNPTGTQSIYQNINVSGSAGDAFVLSGWGKGNSVPFTDELRQFGLKITFNNTDGTTSDAVVSFSDTCNTANDWQYVAGRVEATKEYSSVKVELIYNYNMNDAYFDGIQLYKEEFGERYTYDDGNLETVTDILGLTTTYSYNNNDVVKIVEPSGLITENTYSYHNLKKTQRYIQNEDSGVKTYFFTQEYCYDAYGNQIRAYSYFNDSTSSTDPIMESFASYSADGNYLATATDELGNVTKYSYDPNTGVLMSVNYPNDPDTAQTTYTYDDLYRLSRTTARADQNTILSATYTYTGDLLTRIATNSTIYNFTYGDFNQRTAVAIGSNTLANYTYANNQYHSLLAIDYGNRDRVEYSYDTFGRVVKESYKENGGTTVSRTVSYEYNDIGSLATVVDSKTGITTKYYYDTLGRNIGMSETGGNTNHRTQYTYDALGMVHVSKETCGSSSYTTTYEYRQDGQLNKITSGDSSQQYVYDALGRLDKRYTFHGNTDSHLILQYIHYEGLDERSTSSRPSVWAVSTTGTYSVNYNYFYDANGNITSEKVGGDTTSYVYDSANQLLRENNQAEGKTWVWTYDDAGNILSKKEYAYTTGALGAVLDTVLYSYSNTTWGDLLTAYDGKAITYDYDYDYGGIGNPLTYDGWTFTWEHGRELSAMSKNGTTWTYTYDANGLRTKRTTGSTTYTYTYHGSQLTHMTYGSTALHFYYDATGRPLSVICGGATYYYVTNLQGDVVAILDSTGAAVVEYTYDAWGRPLSKVDNTSFDLGDLNPLRYRGYVYDHETGLYYLQSRYYNPEWGRFLNADNLLCTDSPIGCNLYVYCLNNPVNNNDASGHLTSVAIAGIVISGLIGGIAAALNSVAAGKEGWEVAANFFIGVGVGAATATVAAVAAVAVAAGTITTSLGLGAVAAGSAGIGLIGDGLSQLTEYAFHKNDSNYHYDWRMSITSLGYSAAMNTVSGVLSFGINIPFADKADEMAGVFVAGVASTGLGGIDFGIRQLISTIFELF